jgi:hypothetical protein
MRSGDVGITVLALVVAVLMPSPASAQAKSAQSDCARAVASRGYSVTGSWNFRQQPGGWLLDMQVRSPQGQVSSGSCYVQASTGAVTLTGFGGAFENVAGGGANMTFDCASNDGKYRECQLPVDGRARLVKRHSHAPCDENQSWGQRGDRVWVTNGCRARFEVIQGGTAGGGQYFDCRSTDSRYRECRFHGGRNAELVRAYTGNCRKDSTWGLRPGLVWVTAGCQAQFRATGAGAGGGGSSVMLQRTETACRAEAQRQYIAVRQIAMAGNQGSYWHATITGVLRNQPVQADCRYDPQSNRASLFINTGGGAGTGTHLKVQAERACIAHAKRVGYTVYGQSAAESAGSALSVALKLKQGNQLVAAVCYYDPRTGQTRLEQVRPQPR